MDSQNPIPLPKKRQIRTLVFGIRLTQQERETIRSFARQINFPASEMARYFVLQAIAYHSARLKEGSIDAAPTVER
jgi:hypothetical protein